MKERKRKAGGSKERRAKDMQRLEGSITESLEGETGKIYREAGEESTRSPKRERERERESGERLKESREIESLERD